MNNIETVRVTFICDHCGSPNELTAAYLHEATIIHCSRCSTSVAPLAVLLNKSAAEVTPTRAAA